MQPQNRPTWNKDGWSLSWIAKQCSTTRSRLETPQLTELETEWLWVAFFCLLCSQMVIFHCPDSFCNQMCNCGCMGFDIVAGCNFTKSLSFVQLRKKSCLLYRWYTLQASPICELTVATSWKSFLIHRFHISWILARVMRSSSVTSAITHFTSSKTSTGTADHNQYTAKKLPFRSNTTHWADVATGLFFLLKHMARYMQKFQAS